MIRMIILSLFTAFVVSLDGIGSDLPETPVMFLDPICGPMNLTVREACWGRKGVASWEAIDDGHRMRELGDEIRAISHWEHLAIKYEGTDIEAACAALRNVAVSHLNRGEKSAAVSSYKQIVAAGNRAGWNAAYFACKQLSDLYVELDNVDESLRFARMAQCQCTFSTFCGVAELSEQFAIDQRIESLSTAKFTRSKVVLKANQITKR